MPPSARSRRGLRGPIQGRSKENRISTDNGAIMRSWRIRLRHALPAAAGKRSPGHLGYIGFEA
jgi:hypothetical protein